jgi:hypothetical protein
MLVHMLLHPIVIGLTVISAPPAIPHESGSIVVSDQHGAQRWTADWTMEPAVEAGRPAVRFTESGRGRVSPYTQPIQWKLESVWTADKEFHPLRFEKTITDANGRTITTERKTFDPSHRSVKFERKSQAVPSVTRDIRTPADTLTVEGIAGILRFLPFDHWHPLTVHFLTNEPKLYEMKVEMRGKERIKTPAGDFECYRIELVPNLGVLNVLHSFLPKAQFWFSATQPHFWVRYEGLENGPGTPDIVMELKAYR